MMRSTCLYCEQNGVTTPLIPYYHWRVCPNCSPNEAKQARELQEFAQFKAMRNDPLRSKGRPTINGVRQ